MIESESFTCRIWIAGDHHDAVKAVKKWSDDNGDCYSITKVDYVYSGGHEKGVCVTRINYGRFIESKKDILKRVTNLAYFLAGELFQKSFSIETPDKTFWGNRELPCKKD